ncbi:MAG: CotH kinase family protein [Verrucomicrobia bacterium]|nr:CotH kinase family protein [Verrucomicrobiota bacterium]
MEWSPSTLTPDQPLKVQARVQDLDGVARVQLLYQLVAPGSVGAEQALAMEPSGDGRYSATLAAQPGGRILRLRIQAEDKLGGRRFYPGENEPRPAVSVLVQTNFADSALPQIYLIHTQPGEVGQDSHLRPGWGRPAANPDLMRQRMEWALRSGLDMSYVWARLAFDLKLKADELVSLRPMFAEQSRTRDESVPTLSRTVGGQGIEAVRAEIRRQRAEFYGKLNGALRGDSATPFAEWWRKEGASQGIGPRSMSATSALKRLWDLERVFANLSQRDGVAVDRMSELRDFFQSRLAQRDALRPAAESLLKEENPLPRLMERLDPLRQPFEQELEKRFGADALSALETTGRPDASRVAGTPVQGSAAMVYYDPASRKARVFDFIQINPRAAGWKVHLQKDQAFEGMTTLNVIFEMNERFVIAEPMAFEFYRRIGSAACRTDFVRLTIDGDPMGYQLLIEQPNKAFFRHRSINDGGNLYKLLWYGQGVRGQHEKKTHLREGHEDLEKLLASIGQSADPKAQWEAIRKNFNVEQVINYFAANMVLSYWDGFFNNYFTYHDTEGTGKWTMYPWDQDKTWGFHDGIQGNDVFYDMPLTFGTEGDRPPGLMGMFMPRGAFGVGHAWWRPGGWFSKPLLSNPIFRKHYLARIKQILETEYTPEKWETTFQELEAKLRPEVRYRAQLLGEDPADAAKRLKDHVQTLREHLQKRRKFLLNDPEVKSAGLFDPRAL